MNLLDQLNDSQRKAVEAEGIVTIIAGPGTGKTKTLTARIQYLIQEKGINPAEILALTFTKKAATEMKERLSHLSEIPYISTFHALALDLLGNSKKIISEPERLEVLQSLVEKDKKQATKKDIKDISLIITNYKNTLEKEVNILVEKYNALLQERDLIDYDDLLIQLHSLANEERVTKKFNYILVDEFQDTNILQYEILKRLMNNNNLFVIGDPLQSIYSFRGATADIFKKFEEDFPNNTKIQLSINYRSDTSIVKISSELFPKNAKLEAFSQEEGTVNLIDTINEYTEAEWIVKRIDALIGGTDLIKAGENVEKHRNLCFKDFAIIYRTHSFARILENIFVTSGIPYQIVGDNSLYDRPEIKFIITSLKYLHTNSAKFLHELLNSSIVGLSSQTKKQLRNLFKKSSNKFIKELSEYTDLYCDSKKDINVVSTFINELKDIKNELKTKDISKIIHKICETKTIQDYINSKALKPDNIHMFISIFTQFDKSKNSIQKAVEYIEYLEEHEFYDPTVDKVTLMSIHAAKGLEFSEVFIVGFEQGSIPYSKKGVEENREEEKRLLYVALTRAKHNIYVLKTQERFKQKTRISEFASLLQSLIYIEDEAIEKRKKQIAKWKDKKSQLELF